MRFLIVGCGSMGKRRARCLRALGFEDIAACDARQDRLAEIHSQSEVSPYEELALALADGADFALVCAPPHLHASLLLRCIDAGVPAFCEAPLTLTLEEADNVIQSAARGDVFLAPSCTYLHHDIHHMVSEIVREEKFGKPLAALSHVGQHVADWHPYEDYRDFYASKRSEGGMCFDMLPHDLQLFTHFFGDVKALTCMARKRSAEIESDADARDVYDAVLDMEAGVSLVVHQDLFQRPWGNFRKIMCERGAIEWNWHHVRVCEYRGPEFPKAPKWQDITPEQNDFIQDLKNYMSSDKHSGFWMADNWNLRPAPSNVYFTPADNRDFFRPPTYYHYGTTERRYKNGDTGPGVNEIYLDLSAGFWAVGHDNDVN